MTPWRGTIIIVVVVSFNKRFFGDGRGLQEESDGYYVCNTKVLASSIVSPSTGEGVWGNLVLEIWDT